jgi:hypothetical protein
MHVTDFIIFSSQAIASTYSEDRSQMTEDRMNNSCQATLTLSNRHPPAGAGHSLREQAEECSPARRERGEKRQQT